MNLTKEQYIDAVSTKVIESIGNRPWFIGVCIDTIKESYKLGVSIEKAAQIAALDTAYYDSAWHGEGT